jgi:uncharacterized repeat protein (TIGR01451 family)
MPKRLAIAIIAHAIIILFFTFGFGFLSTQSNTFAAENPHLLQATAIPKIGRGEVVRIEYSSTAELKELAARFDVWEVHRESGFLVAYLQAEEKAWVENAGYPFQVDEVRSAQPATIPDYPCYRMVTELYADLDLVANEHPDITKLITIGLSYEGRPVKVLQISNQNTMGDKPVFFLMANIHGRELITPETTMVFINYLTDNYGIDPDVTWVVDHHEIHVSVSTNPDGHVKNEPGEPWAYWRKNTHPYGSCGDTDYGVDLNRNHSFNWACCGGSSGNPCAETYRGPSAASESETQNLESYVGSLFPDRRGPDDDDAAPLDTSGVLITLHSYGNLVLWPWGDKYTPAPNDSGLSALGKKMASFTGYTASQAIGLYPVDGATDDWSYGELGVASFTFEIGSSGDGFYPACSRYDGLITPNIDALFYAAKVVRTPYLTSHGPDALQVEVTPTLELSGYPVQLSAKIDDRDNGGQAIAAAEYYIDIPPWYGGISTTLSAADGTFDSLVEGVSAPVSTAGLKEGRHTIYVRGQDQNGYWGPVSAVFLDLHVNSVIAGQVIDGGNGEPVSGVTIRAENQDFEGQTLTDKAGDYFLPVIADQYQVSASAFGYYSTTVEGVTAATGLTTTVNLTLTAMPTGTLCGLVEELGTNLPIPGAVVRVDGSTISGTTNTTGIYSLTLPIGTYSITASASGHLERIQADVMISPGETTEVNFLLPVDACVLLVDDDYSGSITTDYEAYYTAALNEGGYLYNIWEVESNGTPSAETLALYPVVLWFTGEVRSGTLNIGEQTALREYLNDSGALFLTGGDIAYDVASDPGDFLGEVLGASFITDAITATIGVTTIYGADIFSGQAVSISDRNQVSPDVIAPEGDALPVFRYLTGEVVGISLDAETYRSIFLSFGVENVIEGSDRRDILQNGLEWLGCSPVDIDFKLTKQASAETIKPGETLIYTLTLENASAVSLTQVIVSDTLPEDLTYNVAFPQAEFDAGIVRWSELVIPPEGFLSLRLETQVAEEVAPGTVIRNLNYQANAAQFPHVVTGWQVVETLVIEVQKPVYMLYFPVIW